MKRIGFAILLFNVLLLTAPVFAADLLDGWQLLQLSSRDRLAVFKSPVGELRLVKAGDTLGERTTVTDFDDGRIVLEQPGAWGRTTLFVSVVDGRQKVEWMERQPLRKSDVSGDVAAIVMVKDQ